MTEFDHWCRTAAGCVRYLPDRAAVARELRAHYEDHRDALLDCGYPEEEAQARALEALGDPKEVGRALNRAHNPAWGWLWSAAKLCLWVAVLIFCLEAAAQVLYGGETGVLARSRNQLGVPLDAAQTVSRPVPGGRILLTPTSLHDNTWELVLTLDLDSPLGAKPELEALLTVWDERGQLPPLEPSLDTQPRSAQEGYFLWCATDPSWTRYQYWLTVCREDAPPQRVEVRHPAGWSLGLDLEVTP